MRLEVSKKVFIVFFLLMTFTLVLGSTLYVGLKGLGSANRKLMVVKNFQLEASKLETIKHEVILRQSPFSSGTLSAEFAAMIELADEMGRDDFRLDEPLRMRLAKLPDHIGNYRTAYEELFERYERDNAFPDENEYLLRSLEQRAGTLPEHIQDELFRSLNSFRSFQEQAYHDREPVNLQRMKDIFSEVYPYLETRGMSGTVDRLILNVEENYFNYLAILDREAFLKETSALFSRITGDIITSVSDDIHRRQSFMYVVIISILLAAVLTTASLWFLTSRYIQQLLTTLNSAIRSIKAEEYDYAVPPHPDDEFGDLIVFMKAMSTNLGDNIRKVHEGRKFLQKIIDGIAEPIMLIDPQYNVMLMNRKAHEDSGRLPETNASLKCHEISHHSVSPCAGDVHPCPLETVRASKQMVTVEHIHYAPDGSKRHIEIMASPMYKSDGTFEGIIEACRDITDRRKLEEQLLHSQKMQAIGQLTGGIAHDFNNLLTTINGYGEFLRDSLREGESTREYAEMILAAGERAANLTQSLLAFSRKQFMQAEPVDINIVIKNVEKLLLRVIGEDIAVELNLSEEELVVNADSGQLEQIFMNLATNARDAMPSGGSFRIRSERFFIDEHYAETHAIMKTGDYVLISVADTGKGMDRETVDQIFEPFFTTKELGKGTGLGLSVVYGLVKQHDGEIFVYSEPGEGTTFKIYLPLVRVAVKEASTALPPPLRGGNETILLAEDDETVRALLVATLDKFGYRTIVTKDGEEAVRMFGEHRDEIQLLLLDVIMPGLNGLDVYREIRKTGASVKTIFLSGYSAEVLSTKGALEEDMHYISKPISPSELIRKIRDFLDE